MRLDLVLKLTLVLCILIFIISVFEILALHDIHADYVSSRALQYVGATLSKNLPTWTSTTGEWQIVKAGLLARFIFLMLSAAVLILCIKRGRQV